MAKSSRAAVESKVVLGLDVGPNSIGWALIEERGDSGESSLIDAGVRIFVEGVDAFDTAKEKSRSEARRVARGMRKQTARRARRKKRLQAALASVGLWPTEAAEIERMTAADPYTLRAKALTERLEPFEIGRVFLHLNQRRGFLSNKKKDRVDAEVKGLLDEIRMNEEAQRLGGFDTIGAMLADKAANFRHAERQKDADGKYLDHVRNRHLSRRQMEQEFDAVWESQRRFHPDLLTDRLKYGALGGSSIPRPPIGKADPRRNGADDLASFGLHGLLFFQRKMYWPRSVVGQCELEPKQKRCPRADRLAERFRVLTEVNNLRYINPHTREELPLDERQRKILLDYLATRERATFDQIRKLKGIDLPENYAINLEKGKRSSIKGMVVDCLLAKAVGKEWHARPDAEKNAIVRLLNDPNRDEEAVKSRLVDDFGFSSDEADETLGVDLPDGYGNLSRAALEKLVPLMETGMPFQASGDPGRSAKDVAYGNWKALRRWLFDCLPDPKRNRIARSKLGDIPNPVVKRALVELRKVVNSIIREHGKPDAVHLEMARTVQVGAEKRAEMSKRMRDRETQHDAAANAIRNAGLAVRHRGIVKYLLWEEQGYHCVYCSKPISLHQLLDEGLTDIDHILPRSRTLDDSQMNKVVCHRDCNHEKGQRTPHEWLAGEPERYERVCQHAHSLFRHGAFPYPKYKRFLQKELETDKFIARQLVDTGYIARATGEFLRLLFEKSHSVIGLKGQLTSELRRQWRISSLLSDLPDSPAWETANDLSPGEKNRADHRHHAIDAIVVALTNHDRLQKLTEVVRKKEEGRHDETKTLDLPWPDFRKDVEARIRTIKVSHRVERKVSGALHEETQYGRSDKLGEWVVRKPVENLSPAEVDRIRDSAVRETVRNALAANGLEAGRGKKLDPKRMKAALADLRMPPSEKTKKKNPNALGVPIKKVRLTKPELTIRSLRGEDSEFPTYVKPGSLHHLCLFEYEEKGKIKREAVFVSMLEAMQRIEEGLRRLKQEGRERGETSPSIVRREHPDRPDARFVMSLSSRELVLAKVKGETKLLQFKTAASTQGQLYFVEHTDARRSADQRQFVFKASTLDARKVTVDPLGRLRWAND